MKKFIIKLSSFSVIILLSIAYYGNFIPPVATPDPNDYMANLIDKDRRADSIKTPKIILVGGSNLAFGVDSKMLRKELGVPVINMGLHASLGVDFMLNHAKRVAKENDIVFLSIEYFIGADGQYDLQKHTSRMFPKATNFYSQRYFLEVQNYLNASQKIYKDSINKRIDILNKKIIHFLPDKKVIIAPTIIPSIVPPAKPIQQISKISIYSRQAANQDGDIVAHLEEPTRENLESYGTFVYKHWEVISSINDFAEYAKAKNIKVFYFFPNYHEQGFATNKQVFLLLEDDLKNKLNIEILNKPSDFVYPNNHFFDTHYHLNKIGREKRTKDMVNIIKNNEKIMLLLEKMKK